MLHLAFLYRRPDDIVEQAGAFLEDGARHGEALVALTVPARRVLLEARLGAAARQLRWADAGALAAEFTTKGEDSLRYRIEALVAEARAGRERDVRIYGEVVEVLVRQGAWESAIALERFWDALVARGGLRVLCAYAAHEAGRPQVQAALGVHP